MRHAVPREAAWRIVLWYVVLAFASYALMQIGGAIASSTRLQDWHIILGWYTLTTFGVTVLIVRYPLLWIVCIGSGMVVAASWAGVVYPIGTPLVQGYGVIYVPAYSTPIFLIVVVLTYLIVRIWRRVEASPIPEPRCIECGYPRRGIKSDRCPECGHEYPHDPEIWIRQQR